jgi:hypothetical protein
MAAPLTPPMTNNPLFVPENLIQNFLNELSKGNEREVTRAAQGTDKTVRTAALAALALRAKRILKTIFSKKENDEIVNIFMEILGSDVSREAKESMWKVSASEILGRLKSARNSAWSGAQGAACKVVKGVEALAKMVSAAIGRIAPKSLADVLKSDPRLGLVDVRTGAKIPVSSIGKIKPTEGYYLVNRYTVVNATKWPKTSRVAEILKNARNWRYIAGRYKLIPPRWIVDQARTNGLATAVRSWREELAKAGKRPRVATLERQLHLSTLQLPRVPYGIPNSLRGILRRPEQKSPSNERMNEIEALISDFTNAENFEKERLRIHLQSVQNAKAAARLLKELRQRSNKKNYFKTIYGITYTSNTPLETLLRLRIGPNFSRYNSSIRNDINSKLRSKLISFGSRLSNGNMNTAQLMAVSQALRTNPSLPGASSVRDSLRIAIRRIGSNPSNLRENERRYENIRRAARNVSGVNGALRNARSRLNRIRREENERRRNRGLAPLARYNYAPPPERIPFYGQNTRPRGYGNVMPAFAPPVNVRQPSIVPEPPMPQPPLPIPARQAPPPPIESILPPAEAEAVQNVGGVNKALNLVENAGGPANVAKTANMIRNAGSPNAAIAAGANAKNVKIVLQLGGVNNALKVASAVPKIKRRRRRTQTKKKKAERKPPRVKEIKKLIKFLGSKENLVKRLPDPENKEKKLTKNQVVSKITQYLLRK